MVSAEDGSKKERQLLPAKSPTTSQTDLADRLGIVRMLVVSGKRTKNRKGKDKIQKFDIHSSSSTTYYFCFLFQRC